MIFDQSIFSQLWRFVENKIEKKRNLFETEIKYGLAGFNK